MNLVLMVIDGLRYDYALTIPVIRSVAQWGLWFERMYAPGTFTAAVIPSIVSGMYPPRHGQRFWTERRDAFRKAQVHTLMDFLQGYNQAIKPDWGLGVCDWTASSGTAHNSAHVVSSRETLLDAVGGDRPFFLYTHWLGIHDHVCMLSAAEKPRGVPREFYAKCMRGVEGYPNAPLETLAGEYPDTLWVICSDHGMALEGDVRVVDWRDSGCGHLFDYRTRVACAIFGPGIEPRVVKGVHSLVDLLPSILDRLGMSAMVPPGFLQMQGRSVFSGDPNPYVYMEGFSPGDRIWPSDEPNVFGATNGRIKAVETPLGWEYYDLLADPEERIPAPLEGTEEAGALREFIQGIKSD